MNVTFTTDRLIVIFMAILMSLYILTGHQNTGVVVSVIHFILWLLVAEKLISSLTSIIPHNFSYEKKTKYFNFSFQRKKLSDEERCKKLMKNELLIVGLFELVFAWNIANDYGWNILPVVISLIGVDYVYTHFFGNKK